tara:strand:- start:698 stop:838 length:141 start_codon:yes stop_codon:yes gene_type:complete
MSEDKTYRIVSRDYQTNALFIVDEEGEPVSEPMETMDEAMKALEEM